MDNNINLNLYKTFYDVARFGSISAAAKQTFISQPAISKNIKNLESILGVKLFYRTLSGVELTEDGKQLYNLVESSFNSLILGNRMMIESSSLEKGKLSIGMPSNIGTFYLFDKIIEFHQKYPNIEITIITGGTSKLLGLLMNHTVDFVIDSSPINTQNKNFIIKPLETCKYVFIAKSDSIHTKENITRIKDLSNKQLILPIPGTANRNDLEDILINNNIKINNVLNVHTSEMIISFVKKDLGIGYVIEDLVKEEIKNGEIKIIDIKEDLPTVMINLVYNLDYLTNSPKVFINDFITKID